VHFSAVVTATLIDPQAKAFYQRALTALDRERVEYLVGGAYAFARYTGIERHTKDFDIFIRRRDLDRALSVLRELGYRTEITFSHWIGKAYGGDDFIDLIYGSGNGIAAVDDVWFENAVPETVLDLSVRLIPAEEMIWSKGLIMERERFDGADVAHVIRALGSRLDWRRLIDRFGRHWRALYAHLVLFGYIYPSEREQVPAWVMQELGSRIAGELESTSTEKVCFGTILSRQQYLKDIHEWGYLDPRLEPLGTMSADEIAQWTAGIEKDGSKE
jgi:hypothetical protein